MDLRPPQAALLQGTVEPRKLRQLLSSPRQLLGLAGARSLGA